MHLIFGTYSICGHPVVRSTPEEKECALGGNPGECQQERGRWQKRSTLDAVDRGKCSFRSSNAQSPRLVSGSHPERSLVPALSLDKKQERYIG